MSGWDTLRGVGFQHAAAILAALDVVEDPAATALQIEGTADVIDLQVIAGPSRRSAQVRSREEPYTWQPAEIAQVLKAWLASNPGPEESFEFITDAQLSADSVKRLRPVLERLAAGDLSSDDFAYLAKLGLPEADDRLRRVTFKTRIGATTALLASATTRVSSLLDAGGASFADASDAVARLFQLVAIRGGEKVSERRLFLRRELAEALGIDIAAIDAGDAWDQFVRVTYLASFTAREATRDPLIPPEPAITQSGTLIPLSYKDSESQQAIVFGAPPSVVDLLSRGHVGITGPAGSGKSSTLRLLARELAKAGRVPALVSVASYTEGDLLPRVQRAIQRRVGRPLRPDAAAAALREAGGTLLIDGLTGLSEEARQALIADLRLLRERLPHLTVIATDRDGRLLRRVGLTIFELAGLNHNQRSGIAAEIVGPDHADNAVEDIGETLPDAVSSPLLLTMALRLWDVTTRFDAALRLYDAALEALRERSDTTFGEAELEAVSRVAFRMVEVGQYTADLYWWMANLRAALDEITTEGMFSTNGVTAESALDSAKSIGLLQSDTEEAVVGFIHDSFRDYLVARALTNGARSIPDTLSEPWEPAIAMVAEASGVSPEIAAAARGNVVLCAKLAPLDRDGDGERLADAVELVRFVIDTHFGGEPLWTPRAELAIAASATTSHRYLLLTSTAPSGPVIDLNEFSAAVTDAVAVMAFPITAGPLSIAFGVWRELIALSTSQETVDVMRGLPETDDELLALIADDFQERQRALREAIEAHAPTLADRLLAEIGWYGLRARLGRPRETHLGPGFMEFSRALYFDTRTNVIDVGLVDDTSPDELAALQLPETAELHSYLEYQPRASALKALTTQLDKLAPREDLRA
jgi:hypothetical protein